MAKYYDRYEDFRSNGEVSSIPFIKLTPKSSDKRDVYKQGRTRFDKLSSKWYNNPYHGFLIALANPQFGMEFDIPDGEIIRIPFPFDATLKQYKEAVIKYKTLYGE